MNETGAPMTRVKSRRSEARALWLARLRRRGRLMASLALQILAWQKGARALAPAAWVFIFSSVWLAADIGRVGWFAIPSLVLFLCLGAAALIDARYFVLPDGPLAMLAATGAAMRLITSPQDFISYLAAAAFAFAIFRAAASVFERVRGISGLGQGDAGLFAMAGLWLGWSDLPSCLLIATLSAALAAAISFHDQAIMTLRDPLPFGPHLALGIWIVWAVGPLSAA